MIFVETLASDARFEVNLRMLLSIASTCNWFDEQQGEQIEMWFEEVVGVAEERRMRFQVGIRELFAVAYTRKCEMTTKMCSFHTGGE